MDILLKWKWAAEEGDIGVIIKGGDVVAGIGAGFGVREVWEDVFRVHV